MSVRRGPCGDTAQGSGQPLPSPHGSHGCNQDSFVTAPTPTAPRNTGRSEPHTLATKRRHKRCCVIKQHTSRPAGPGPCFALTRRASAPTPQSQHMKCGHARNTRFGLRQGSGSASSPRRGHRHLRSGPRSALAAGKGTAAPTPGPLPLLPPPPPCLGPAAALTAAREDRELRQEQRGPAEPAQDAPPPPRRHLGAPAGPARTPGGGAGGGAGPAEGPRNGSARAAPHGRGHPTGQRSCGKPQNANAAG